MPITYEVHKDGHFIHAVASRVLTGDEFVEYEVAHAIDERIKPPVSELLEVQHGACREEGNYAKSKTCSGNNIVGGALLSGLATKS